MILKYVLFLCCVRILTKSHLGEGRVYFGLLVMASHQAMAVVQDRNTEAGTKVENHRGALPTGLFSLACLACFVIQPRVTYPEVALPTVSWALLT